MKTPVLLVTATLTLTGCAGMGDDFSCNKVDGISGCASMTDIHQMVDKGTIRTDKQGRVYQSFKEAPLQSTPTVKATQSTQPPPTAITFPYRTPDKVAKLVFFPFRDPQGNLHDTRTVYTILTPSHWSTQAVNSLKEDAQ